MQGCVCWLRRQWLRFGVGYRWIDNKPGLNIKTPKVVPPCNKHKGISCNSRASWSWDILKNRHTFKNVQNLHKVPARRWEQTGLPGERTYSDDMLSPHWKATDPRIEPVTFLLYGDSANHRVAPPLWRWSKTTAFLFTNKRDRKSVGRQESLLKWKRQV